MIRVLLVDDHAVVRSGLRLLLEQEQDIECAGEAGDAEEAIREARRLRPDVVLLDVVMPGRSGVSALPAILEAAPGARVLVLSMQDDPSYVREAFGAGAVGYVLKEAADTEVVAAVREIAGGGRYADPALGAQLATAEAEARARAEQDPLSDREREVLRLLALGHTNQEIAKMLFISARTAETHRAHIMQKLRLSSRAELCSLRDRERPPRAGLAPTCLRRERGRDLGSRPHRRRARCRLCAASGSRLSPAGSVAGS